MTTEDQQTTTTMPTTEEPKQEDEITGPVVTEKVTTLDTVNDIVKRIKETEDNFKADIKTILSDLKSVAKVVGKLERRKNRKRTVDPNKPRAPSGITKPVPVSDELGAFLGLEKGELIPRTVVTKRLTDYVISNNLKDPADGRQFILEGEAGKKLEDLLKPDKPLGFFNLQTFLKVHFLKNTESPTTTPVVETPVTATPVTVTAPATPTPVAPTTPVAKKTKETPKVRTARRVRKTRKDIGVTN